MLIDIATLVDVDLATNDAVSTSFVISSYFFPTSYEDFLSCGYNNIHFFFLIRTLFIRTSRLESPKK